MRRVESPGRGDAGPGAAASKVFRSSTRLAWPSSTSCSSRFVSARNGSSASAARRELPAVQDHVEQDGGPEAAQMQSMKDSPKTSTFRLRAFTAPPVSSRATSRRSTPGVPRRRRSAAALHPLGHGLTGPARSRPRPRPPARRRPFRAPQRAVVRGDAVTAEGASPRAAGRGCRADGEAVGSQDVGDPGVHQVRRRPARARPRHRFHAGRVPGGEAGDEATRPLRGGCARGGAGPRAPSRHGEARRPRGPNVRAGGRTGPADAGRRGRRAPAAGRARVRGAGPHLVGQACGEGPSPARSKVTRGRSGFRARDRPRRGPPGKKAGGGRSSSNQRGDRVVERLIRRSGVHRIVARLRHEPPCEVVGIGQPSKVAVPSPELSATARAAGAGAARRGW